MSSRDSVFDGARIFTTDGETNAPPELVLIASSNTDVRQRWLHLFEDDGYAVLPTSSEAETLDAAAALMPSLIVLDEKLGDTSGDSMLDRLRMQPETAELPVLLCLRTLDGVIERDDARLMLLDYSTAQATLLDAARDLMEKTQETESLLTP
jgi:CheY-like chemotaxis protein